MARALETNKYLRTKRSVVLTAARAVRDSSAVEGIRVLSLQDLIAIGEQRLRAKTRKGK
jgi:hypothetical protein